MSFIQNSSLVFSVRIFAFGEPSQAFIKDGGLSEGFCPDHPLKLPF